MGAINVSGHLSKKSIVKDMSGNIINLFDEAGGGWIIRNRSVVNVELYNKYVEVEKDKREAAKAASSPASAPSASPEQRSVAPSKLEEMDKRIDGLDSKLDAILKAINK